MHYAPIIITTLNRDAHLKRCIESLKMNGWAKYTDLYISLDYPPSPKYEEGYRKVKEYLENGIDGFNSVNIFKQEANLGAVKNAEYIISIVKKKYPCWIITEDDNEFSNNFIEYMDKGLELYKDDESVIAMCAYKDAEWYHKKDENAIKLQNCPAYGIGFWSDKYDVLLDSGNAYMTDPKTLAIKNMISLYKKSKLAFSQYISEFICRDTGLFWHNGKVWWCDSMLSIYMKLTSHYCVVPTVAKSRTWGNDGSGVNMPKVEGTNPALECKLDTADSFEFSCISEGMHIQNQIISDREIRAEKQWKKTIKAWINYIILMVFMGKRERYLKLKNFLKKCFKKAGKS